MEIKRKGSTVVLGGKKEASEGHGCLSMRLSVMGIMCEGANMLEAGETSL